jgi:hypothetical protein
MSTLVAMSCGGAAMYSRPLGPGEEAAVLETIVAVDLLAFDGKKPVGSGLNKWKLSPGSHQLTAQVDYAGILSSDTHTASFDFNAGHSYWMGFRAFNMKKEEQMAGGEVASGDWEMALLGVWMGVGTLGGKLRRWNSVI